MPAAATVAAMKQIEAMKASRPKSTSKLAKVLGTKLTTFAAVDPVQVCAEIACEYSRGRLRIDRTNGAPYTKADFARFYGAAEAEAKWAEAIGMPNAEAQPNAEAEAQPNAAPALSRRAAALAEACAVFNDSGAARKKVLDVVARWNGTLVPVTPAAAAAAKARVLQLLESEAPLVEGAGEQAGGATATQADADRMWGLRGTLVRGAVDPSALVAAIAAVGGIAARPGSSKIAYAAGDTWRAASLRAAAAAADEAAAAVGATPSDVLASLRSRKVSGRKARVHEAKRAAFEAELEAKRAARAAAPPSCGRHRSGARHSEVGYDMVHSVFDDWEEEALGALRLPLKSTRNVPSNGRVNVRSAPKKNAGRSTGHRLRNPQARQQAHDKAHGNWAASCATAAASAGAKTGQRERRRLAACNKRGLLAPTSGPAATAAASAA
jgi:hypothetical protein